MIDYVLRPAGSRRERGRDHRDPIAGLRCAGHDRRSGPRGAQKEKKRRDENEDMLPITEQHWGARVPTDRWRRVWELPSVHATAVALPVPSQLVALRVSPRVRSAAVEAL
ncbi:unnamed protein product [Prorocentrum cordatum]|uniref:Uncharacterized protein n=1 Tax=Prorocentrum cordatum TaxID=2364126 RepID=A0ABN9R923_9DINO|nr:unnamed protein product [Polarella glacialis]